MTKSEAIRRLRGAHEDETFGAGEEEEMFCALYGREPDDEDREAGLVSLCYAATDEVSR